MNSCVGCKFLYGDGSGYSDYTWLDTEVRCAKDLNPKLPVAEPYDWDRKHDNLPATMDGRCASFSPGEYITISPDGEVHGDATDDEQKEAIASQRYVEGWSKV